MLPLGTRFITCTYGKWTSVYGFSLGLQILAEDRRGPAGGVHSLLLAAWSLSALGFVAPARLRAS